VFQTLKLSRKLQLNVSPFLWKFDIWDFLLKIFTWKSKIRILCQCSSLNCRIRVYQCQNRQTVFSKEARSPSKTENARKLRTWIRKILSRCKNRIQITEDNRFFTVCASYDGQKTYSKRIDRNERNECQECDGQSSLPRAGYRAKCKWKNNVCLKNYLFFCVKVEFITKIDFKSWSSRFIHSAENEQYGVRLNFAKNGWAKQS